MVNMVISKYRVQKSSYYQGNIQIYGLAMVHVYKAWYYHGTMYKKHDFTMVNVQKTWCYHSTCKNKVSCCYVQKIWFYHGKCAKSMV